MATMAVELVSAERRLWSGDATMVIARTVEGEIGILPGHAPVLAELASGVLRVQTVDEGEMTAAVHGGFLSVGASGVSVLADVAELAVDIDLQRAREAYDRAQHSISSSDDAEALELLRRAETRLRAAGQTVS